MATIQDTYEVGSKADTGGIKQASGALGALKGALTAIKSVGTAPFKAIGGAIAGIGKGMAVFGLAAQGLKAAGEMIGKVTGALKEASPAFGSALGRVETRLASFKDILFRNLGDVLAPLLEKVADILGSTAFSEFFNDVQFFVFNVLKTAVPLVTTLLDYLTGGTDDLQPFVDTLTQILGPDIANFIGDIVVGLNQLITAITTGNWDILGEDWGFNNEIFMDVLGTIGSIANTIKENWPLIQKIFGLFGEAISALTSGDLETFAAKMGEIWTLAKPYVETALGDLWTAVKGFVETNAPLLGQQLLLWAGEFVKWVPTALTDLLLEAAILATRLEQWVQGIVPTIKETLKSWVKAFVAWLNGDGPESAKNQIGPALQDFLTSLVTSANSIVTSIKNIGGNFAKAIIEGMVERLTGISFAEGMSHVPPGLGRDILLAMLHDMHIPGYASGAIVSQPQLAVVGDNRRSPEAIAPLSDLLPMIQQAVAAGGVAPGNISVTVTVGQVTIANGEDRDGFLRAVADAAEQGLRQALGQSTRYPLGLTRG